MNLQNLHIPLLCPRTWQKYFLPVPPPCPAGSLKELKGAHQIPSQITATPISRSCLGHKHFRSTCCPTHIPKHLFRYISRQLPFIYVRQCVPLWPWYYRIIERFELEGTSKTIQFQLSHHEQGKGNLSLGVLDPPGFQLTAHVSTFLLTVAQRPYYIHCVLWLANDLISSSQ